VPAIRAVLGDDAVLLGFGADAPVVVIVLNAKDGLARIEKLVVQLRVYNGSMRIQRIQITGRNDTLKE
jgi:hypothetical protein